MIYKKYLFFGFNPITTLLQSAFILIIAAGTIPKTHAQSSSSIDTTLELKAVAELKYSKVRLVANPGSTIRISLANADEMMHNMLIVKPGSRIEVVKQAEAMGEEGMENSYIPSSSNVLANTPLLKPGEEASFIFQVPDKEAIYPYVCTFPAHGWVMYGALYATRNPDELPPLSEDPHIPEPVRNEMAASQAMHPYPMEKPVISRLFMPGASPAAIAVGMEQGQSYTWDAGYSFLRYAWSGGYIDASEQWEAKAHEKAKVVGDIYYRNTVGFPFRIGQPDLVAKPEFLGYRMVEGYPRFSYTIGKITVHELILPAETTPGFRIKYVLENVDQPVWYGLSENEGVTVEVSKGKIQDNLVKLTPEEAQEFSISVVAK